MGKKDTFRIVTRGSDGSMRIRDFPDPDALLNMHTQIGVDDSSADLALRGMPVFRGLIGPLPEGKNIVRYESPEVFETVTKEWGSAKIKRRRRRTAAPESVEAAESVAAEVVATEAVAADALAAEVKPAPVSTSADS